ncbi:sensor histidine kinase [Leisingera sp. ANG-M7]|uniref:sensor histidine kinase n=1 Tax=Leisingera sp. ANG-M7 TaxID=1577902 RepID=UPI00057D1737|nr:HAMP domain-containing sensor histidine kinase [Leisingera sp. ANG-M7]KIC38400.1 ATPase [Leisingera sp. ANG-M7]
MTRARVLLRSSPVRQSLWLSLLFVAASALSLGVTYYVAHGTQDRAIRESLMQDMAGFRATPSAAALAALVNAETAETDPQRRLLSYRRPGGRIVAGNAAIMQQQEGFRVVALGPAPVEIAGRFISLSAYIHGGLLTVAQSARPLEELRQTYLRVVLFSLLPAIAAAVLGGVLLARRAARSLAGIETTLSALTSGDLGARVPQMPGRQGDIARIGRSVNRMAEAQQQSTEALRQVSADIAHDLKTPIQRLAVQLQRLQDTPGLPQAAQVLAGTALEETRGITSTFQALLQIAQLEDGAPRARFEAVDLCELAATFAEIYEPAAEEQGRRLSLSLPETPATVTGDRTLLGQLLANLIENALRHTQEGSAISLSLRQEGASAVLSVRDHGPGIPEKERGKVLRRLYRLERSRTTPGSGLGLSLAAAIAGLHGAALQLSDAKPGLRVEVVFET